MTFVMKKAVLVAANSPPNLEQQLFVPAERTWKELAYYIKQETGYVYEWTAEAKRSRFDDVYFMTNPDTGIFEPDDCGNGVQRSQVYRSCGVPGFDQFNELGWEYSVDGVFKSHRWAVVYCGKEPNGYAGGGGNSDPGQLHDGSMEDYGESVYGARSHWYLAELGDRDCKGRIFMNLPYDQFARDELHEGLHHLIVETHWQAYTPSASMTWEEVAGTVPGRWSVRQLMDVNGDWPLPVGVWISYNQVSMTTVAGDTLQTMGQKLGAERWQLILDENAAQFATFVVAKDTAVRYPADLSSGIPMQQFQRDMFVANNPRWITKAPVVLPPPIEPPAEIPVPTPLTVTPNPMRLSRFGVKREQQLEANKPMTNCMSSRPSVATVTSTGLIKAVKQGECVIYVSAGAERAEIAVRVSRW